ncbi:MAG: ATP synthase F1 subunit gamma [Deltaproteobacteria bacterium]|nr:ATP synthase F1 subunit gamma [Deltaproteobacteria bacterium]
MPSLKDIKRRIKSVKNTQQITKAMKMVSAAKLKRAQDEIVAARPYAEKINELTMSLASATAADSHPLLARHEGNRVALIVMTSDRGLCGSFNASMIRTVERYVRESVDAELSYYFIGKRGIEYFKKRKYNIFKERPVGGARPSYASAVEIATLVMGMYLNNEIDEVNLVYSEFKSALTQKPAIQRLLPISAAAPALAEGAQAPAEETGGIEAKFEPSKAEVLAALLPKYVEVQVFRALLESSASEHGSRMTSMDSASKNASAMIGGLTLKYNRLRQAAITKELMEIIGGAEALK